MIAIDAAYRIMIFNRAAEKALGYSAQEVVGRRAIPIFMDPAELLERARTPVGRAGRARPGGPGNLHAHSAARRLREARMDFHPQGRHRGFPANVIITPLRDEDGAVAGFLGVIEDVSAGARSGAHEERIHRGGEPRAAHAADLDPRIARA